MKDTLKEIRDEHGREIAQFIKDCPHTDIEIEDNSGGFGQRTITLRCKRCRLNLLGYIIDNTQSYLSYVRDCVNGHPSNR